MNGTCIVAISYHWLDEERNIVRYDNERTVIPPPLGAGERVTVDASIRARSIAGRYILQWDLVVERVSWFSLQGVVCPECIVEIQA